jgi:hypothetical protein
MFRDLVSRVRALMVAPRRELPTTLPDSGLPAVLFRYVIPLAAIGPLMLFLVDGVLGAYHPGATVGPITIPGSWTRAPGPALVKMVLSFVLGVGAWALLGLALAALAPWFGGLRDRAGAAKAAAYTLTPVWLAGALGLFGALPYLDVLPSLALAGGLAYAVFIGMLAVPLHLGAPEAKAPALILVGLGITIVILLLCDWLLSMALAPLLR